MKIDEKLFENIIDNLGKDKKKKPAKKEKPYYMQNLRNGKLEDVNNPRDSLYPAEATPEQVGALAERLERTRQQQGKPTRVDEFEKAFNKIKKPIKIDIPFVSLPDPIAVRRDPQQELRTQRFNRMVEDSERKKLREQS